MEPVFFGDVVNQNLSRCTASPRLATLPSACMVATDSKLLGGLLKSAYAPVLKAPTPDRITALLRLLDSKA